MSSQLAAGVGRWRHRAAQAAGFGWRQWQTLGEAVGTLIAVSVALRFVRLPRLAQWATAARPGAGLSDAGITETARLVGFAGHTLGFKCLVRSLTLARLLARQGVATDIHLGVQPEADSLKAHAWVERNGHALNDSLGYGTQFTPINAVGTEIRG